MFRVSASTEIAAPPLAVWNTIIQMDEYADWNSQLHYLGGALALGETIQLKLTPLGQQGYEFKPKIIAFEPEREFAWVARTGFKGLFDGEHHFVIHNLGYNRSRLDNFEIYSGLLSPIMQQLPMMKGANEGFAVMNEEIKKKAESLCSA